MSKERAILRNMKTSYKAELTSLKHYIRELKERCKELGADKEQIEPDLMKARHDSDYYKTQIKAINARLKDLSSG